MERTRQARPFYLRGGCTTWTSGPQIRSRHLTLASSQVSQRLEHLEIWPAGRGRRGCPRKTCYSEKERERVWGEEAAEEGMWEAASHEVTRASE